jgi:hypothetical protein
VFDGFFFRKTSIGVTRVRHSVASMQADRELKQQLQRLEAEWRQRHGHELAEQLRMAAERERQSVCGAHASLDAQHKVALEQAAAEAWRRCAVHGAIPCFIMSVAAIDST